MFTGGVGTIASLALALVKLGVAVFKYFEAKVHEEIGESREKLRQFVALSEISSVLNAVDERFARMTDDEVKDEITKQGDWRD